MAKAEPRVFVTSPHLEALRRTRMLAYVAWREGSYDRKRWEAFCKADKAYHEEMRRLLEQRKERPE